MTRAHSTAAFIFMFALFPSQYLATDTDSLLNFKSTVIDPSNRLGSWTNGSSFCGWAGVSCSNASLSPRVNRLVLEDFGLRGSASSLRFVSLLTDLRVLSIKNNVFSGEIPAAELAGLQSLKLLFLSHNNFSGSFPTQLLSLPRLYRLDLSFNLISGTLPIDEINSLTHLLTLRLENNHISGPISAIQITSLQDFNVSSNLLSGVIPVSLSGFPRSAFQLNSELCGYPLDRPCGARGNITSSPSSLPMGMENQDLKEPKKRSRIGAVMVLVIVLGDILVLGLITALLFCYFSKRGSKLIESTEKLVYGGQNITGRFRANEEDRGRMVFFQGAKRFELDDLLKASAEMLGKGNFGTSYKAILDSGDVVAVKRLKDGAANGPNRKDFEQHIEVLGRVNNPNLVSLVAYYFSKEEKLIVSDYMPNGSLFWALHGNRGPGRLPVDWVTRLRIAAGAARGIAYIHESLKLVHGSIKSTNILLDKTGNARVSDYGLHLVALPMAGVKADGYRAPEAAVSDWRKMSQKSDVYSFGVVLLEILTGRCPSWVGEGGSGGAGFIDLPRWVQSVVREEWTAEVFDLELMRFKDIEEEMVALLQIATACTSTVPDQRPKMRHVARMIDELSGLQVSPSPDYSESSDTTSAAASQ